VGCAHRYLRNPHHHDRTEEMNDDIIERLRALDPDGCWGCGEWGCRTECTCECHEARQLLIEAADQIERLRKRNNYLTQELNATDYRKREQAEEIERLRSLITAWADAWDEQGADVQGQGSYHDVTVRRIDTGDALRKAVGR
jgi:hypothetical protein